MRFTRSRRSSLDGEIASKVPSPIAITPPSAAPAINGSTTSAKRPPISAYSSGLARKEGGHRAEGDPGRHQHDQNTKPATAPHSTPRVRNPSIVGDTGFERARLVGHQTTNTR